MKNIKKYASQTKNIMRWERKQKKANEKIGFAWGMIAGSLSVGVIYFLLLWML
jgi:hypothetical protein